MINKPFNLGVTILALAVMGVTACTAIGQEPAPTPTSTAVPTRTPRSTSTITASPTPDAAATQRVDDFLALITSFHEKGYLESTNGTVVELKPDFQSGHNYFGYEMVLKDFFLSAHYTWEHPEKVTKSIGCVFQFAINESASQPKFYEVNFNNSKIVFDGIDATTRPAVYWTFKKTKGDRSVNFADRTETDFAFLVSNQLAYIYHDGEITRYELTEKWSTEGKINFY